MVDWLGERGRFVWSRLERRGTAFRSLARRRAGPSCTEAQHHHEWRFGAPHPPTRFPTQSLCCASRLFACSASFARTSWLSDNSEAASSTAVRAKNAKLAKAREEQQQQQLSRVYEIQQILRVTLFEQGPIQQLLTPPPRHADQDFEPRPLVLL